ncbi:MAG: hypothetical protein QOF83_4224, partial [Solirubrobacteraceae bacterium]|nr:hypothetical protein [Solirubrobacteraceae bacterium]
MAAVAAIAAVLGDGAVLAGRAAPVSRRGVRPVDPPQPASVRLATHVTVITLPGVMDRESHGERRPSAAHSRHKPHSCVAVGRTSVTFAHGVR